ncbi:MAG: FGGY family carbohydrate kinase, partial [Actinomycetota bacterium]
MDQKTSTLAGEVLLGIDLGTSRIKAVLLAADGYQQALDPVATPWDTTGGRVEAPVEAFRNCLEKLLQQVEHPHRVAGIGIAGMAESGAAFSDRLRPLTPVISWHDPRGEGGAGSLRARFPGIDEEVGQRLRNVSSAAKLAQLSAEGLTGVGCWLGVPEIFLWLLTGETATEHSLISRTGWYGTARMDYLPAVAEAAGLPPGGLLPVNRAGEVMGQTRFPGLKPGIPVT